MTNEVLIVSVLTIVGSLYMFYIKIRNQILNEEANKSKPIIELNTNIIKLNETIKHLIEDIGNLKDRVKDHEKQIDTLKLDVEELKTKMNIYHKGS